MEEKWIDEIFDLIIDFVESMRNTIKIIVIESKQTGPLDQRHKSDFIEKYENQIFPDMMNAEIAAQYLSISAQTLHNWRHKEKGPIYIKIGGRIIYKKKDLDLYIKENTRYGKNNRGS